MFCKFCGKELTEQASFCHNCGAPMTNLSNAGGGVGTYAVSPGFSNRINDPAILNAQKKNNKAAAIFALFLVPMPIIIASIIGIKEGNMSYVGYGAAISLIFMLFNAISAIRKKSEKQWDGVVTEKYKKEISERASSGDDNYSTYTVYITKFKKDNGGVKKLEEREYDRQYYDYLNIGDRVRYHPQFNCYYEKFDKSRDSYAICPICSSTNSIENDTCGRCGVPVIK